MKKRLPAAVLAAALLPALAACGSDDSPGAADAPSSAATGGSASTGGAASTGGSAASGQAASLTVSDPWIKATDATPDGEAMTAAFGTLTNTGSEAITVVGAATKAAGLVELHETVQNSDGSMAMQPKKGGFVVPAGGSLTLEPGGNHIMLMDLTASLAAGEVVPVTLTLDDGSTAVIEATVKPFEGADEKYQGGGSGDMGDMGDMSGMDHSGMGHSGSQKASEGASR
ncbi:copper chaperone PCu(A)C [Nocardioides sp.]|uniref:copper chaperone PCu(A)C n=1 Tax=Nocardioides sp. TaxID=35761 RepID=UPI003518D5AA